MKHPEAKPGPRDLSHVQSVMRALDLLEALSAEPEGLRLSDLARRCGLSVSTVHRLLTTLQYRGFVQFDQAQSIWRVGRSAFLVGSAYVQQRNFVAPALPYLRSLRDQTRETANLGVLSEGQVTVLTQVESREIMRAITRVGGQVPVNVSGMGKAILATYSDADVEAVVAAHGLDSRTRHSKSKLPAFLADIRATRKRGYAVDDEEFIPGLRCLAAPVYGPLGEALCAISISGLSTRLTKERIEELGGLVVAMANRLTTELGGTLPAGQGQ